MPHATPPRLSWHALSAEAALERLGGDAARGLTSGEAARRRKEYGPNVLTTRKGPGAFIRFLRQFHQPLVYILLAAGAATALIGAPVDASVICGVVLVNAVLGYVQEAKAVSALAALATSMVTEATVLRDGKWTVLPAETLVPGDVVRLQAGDKAPADLRLLSAQSLRCDESPLTGESAPVDKTPEPTVEDAPLAERTCLAFAATVVVHGQGRGVVTATGDNAEIGRIAAMTAAAEDLATPLTRTIARFSRVVLAGILVLAGLTFAVGYLRGEPPAAMFMAAVALAVGAIPEGLPAAVTVILAMGVSRMAARRAIIRRLPAVETLGSTTVICTDKTGTLTVNRMTVTEMLVGGAAWRLVDGAFVPDAPEPVLAAGAPDVPGPRDALLEALRAGGLCNDAVLTGEDSFTGDPTEAALLAAGRRAGLDRDREAARLPRLAEEPFDSSRMFMATLHDAGPDSTSRAYHKGTMEADLARSAGACEGPLDAAMIRETAEAMGRRGLRVLALAGRNLPAGSIAFEPGHLESGFVFLGLVGMIDPPRPEAVAAVAACGRAGVMVKMITGDHAATATAIAEKLGLGHGGPVAAMTGRDIDAATDADLPGLARDTQVFARVSPEQKLRLVRALQSLGHVTAMTGDGINDAPALRQADIGVAMGKGGTEAAKEAADMVLVDDNFATIEAAVEEGRGVFDNLTKFIVWTLPTNVGEGLVILTAVLLGTELPISPVQILWINMTTAGTLGLMLAFEPREPDVMSRPPRAPGQPILNAALTRRVLVVGALLLVASFGLYEWELGNGASEAQARTVAVNVFTAMEALYLLNCRSLTRPAFSGRLGGNPFILGGMALALGLQLVLTYVPWLQGLFGTAAIDAMAWGRIAAAAVAGFLVVEVEKRLFRPA